MGFPRLVAQALVLLLLAGPAHAAAPVATTSAATLVTSSGVTLHGSANPNSEAAFGYFRYSATDPGTCDDSFGTRSAPDASLGSGSTPVAYGRAIAGLTAATPYYFCAIAYNASGTSFGAVLSFTTLPSLPAVTTNAATNLTGTDATLNGSANPGGDATTGWFRYSTVSPGTCNDSFGTRAPASGGASLGAGIASAAYAQAVTGLSAGTTYFACAIAANSVGTSFGSVVSFTTPLPPTATTSPASSIANTSAFLNGSSNPNGAATTGWFRYGASDPGTCNDTFGTRAPAASGSNLGSGVSPVVYSQSISGLSPTTIYYFCAIAQSAEGTAFGAVQSFTTADAPTASTTPATLVTSSGVTLRGSANPNSNAAFGHFRYSLTDPGTCNDTFGTRSAPDASLGSGNTPVNFSQAIAGLTPATSYYFCAIANNSFGTSFGAVLSFTTLPSLPAVTTNAATNLTGTDATLNGSANPGGDATTGWFRYSTVSPGTCNDSFGTRAPASGGASLGAGIASAAYAQAITGLSAGTTYFACAIAANSVGTSFGSVVSFTTPLPPTATTSPASSIANTSAFLNGSSNPNGAATTGWFRYAGSDPGACNDTFGTRAPAASGSNLGSGVSPVAYSQSISGLSPKTIYYFCAIAQSAEGTAFGAVQSLTTADAPTASTTPATLVTSSGVTLRGSANPNSNAAFGHFRYSLTDPGTCNDTFGTRSAPDASLGSGNTPVNFSQGITGLTPATAYYFCAIANNSFGTSFGAVLSFTTLPSLPAVTTNAATNLTGTDATLNGSANPGGDATTGWFRYSTVSPGTCNDSFGTRAPASGGASLGAGIASAAYAQAITGLSAGTTYFACAIAANSVGTSFGSVVSFTTPLPPTATTSPASSIANTSAFLNGSSNPNGAATTGWFRYAGSDPGACNDTFGTRAPAASGSNLGSGVSPVAYSQSISGLSPKTIYYFCAIAASAEGTAFGAVQSLTTADAPTASTTPATLVTSSGVTLRGSANPNSNAAFGHFRYSLTDPGTCNDTFGTRSAPDASLGSGNTPVNFSQGITGLTPATAYYFCAIANNSFGTSFGAVLSFTTLPTAPTVTTNSAAQKTDTTATLSGTTNPNGDAATGWFRYATVSPGTCNDSFGTRAPATGGSSLGSGNTNVAYAQAVTGLSAQTTYYVCAIASNSLGTSFGSVVPFTTTLPTFTLTAASAGSGTGTITGTGFNCPSDCTESVTTGTMVTLTATAAVSSTFAGWSGCDSVASNQCTVTVAANRTVTATFNLNSYTVTPSAGAHGSIAPGAPQTVSHGSTTAFTVTPDAGYAATVGGTCGGLLVGNTYTTGAITQDCAVSATFVALVTYNVVLEGWQQSPYVVTAATGSGTAIYNPVAHTLKLNLTYSGLGSAETGAHLHGPAARGANAVVLLPLAANSPKTDELTLFPTEETMLANGQLYVNIHTTNYPNGEIRGQVDNVGATVTRALTVTKTGSGSVSGTTEAGTVISCGADCTETVPDGKVVTITATPDAGSALQGWGGACSGVTTCMVTMDAAKTVSATFISLGSDLGTTITATPNPAIAGRDVTFTMTVSSAGPEAGDGVNTWAFIPSGAIFVSASAGCTQSTLGPNPIVLCTPNVLAIGATAQYTFVLRRAVAGTLTVSADVSSSKQDPVAANNQSSVSVTVNPQTRLGNISTRMRVGTGNDVMIGGFIIGGSSSKKVAVVATGPSLTQYGITNALAHPTLTLVRQSDQVVIATNDGWQNAANAAQLTAAGFAPSDVLESAILIDLAPGAYTAIVSGAGNGTGVGIVAVYEVDHPEYPLINISTRGQVLTGNDVMIGGFIINGSSSETVAIVATGPSLTQYGITNALANPTLTLVRQSDQAVIATNDDWQTTANAAQLQAAGFAPSNPLESAIFITLPPGAYTAILSGAGGGTGVGIIGVYAATP